MDLRGLLLPGGMLHGPRLCGFMRHGVVASSGEELKGQNAERLWNQNSAALPDAFRRGLNEILPEGVVPLVLRGKAAGESWSQVVKCWPQVITPDKL